MSVSHNDKKLMGDFYSLFAFAVEPQHSAYILQWILQTGTILRKLATTIKKLRSLKSSSLISNNSFMPRKHNKENHAVRLNSDLETSLCQCQHNLFINAYFIQKKYQIKWKLQTFFAKSSSNQKLQMHCTTLQDLKLIHVELYKS